MATMLCANTEHESKHTSLKTLLAGIQRGDVDGVKRDVEKLKGLGQTKFLAQVDIEDETILHRAVKMRASVDVIKALVELCPELLSESRQESKLYRGQTVLHIAITGNVVEIVGVLLDRLAKEGELETIISACATGSRFENTVMLGEFPLAVAALTLNTQIFGKILEYGGSLISQNSKGDTLFHSLVKYAYLYPEKIEGIVKMYEYAASIVNGTNSDTMTSTDVIRKSGNMSSKDGKHLHVWTIKNNEGLNPLKLTAKLGQHVLFKITMEMNNVYRFVNSEDGLFDVELYDVTDIDSLSHYCLLCSMKEGLHEAFEKDDTMSESAVDNKCSFHVPTLEMIIGSDPGVVFKFIELSPLRYVISRKWRYYRWFFSMWGFFHVLYMVGFTVYTVRRSDVVRNASVTGTALQYRNTIGNDSYVTFYATLSLVVAVLYLLQEVVRIFKSRMPWSLSHLQNCYHTGPFRLVIVLFGLTTIVDVIWRLVDAEYEEYVLVVSMILGWWFLVFFLRGFRQFSFFTVMIQKVLVGDMFRFSIIITMELIAFTTGMFVAYRGRVTSDENVSEYGKFMVLSFKMMFGFTSLDVLFEAPNPWFAVSLYVAFVLLTYVLMINSLIAMMSNTCSVVSQNREIQCRVQQLSIILFFESIFPVRLLRIVGEKRMCDSCDPDSNTTVSNQRIFMEVRSLHEVTNSKSRHRPNPETMLETIFHTIKSINLPSIVGLETISPDKAENEAVTSRTRSQASAPVYENEAKPERDNSSVPKTRKHKKKKKHRTEDDVTELCPPYSGEIDTGAAEKLTAKDMETLTVADI